MSDRSSPDLRRRHYWRIGWLVCGLAAVIGMLTAVPITSAQAPNPPNNPGITAPCGLKVSLVLDESLSIAQTTNATAATRAAAEAFVTALENTGSPLAITAFSLNGRNGVVPYTEVNPDTIDEFTNWIFNRGGTANPGFNPQGGGAIGSTAGTNWQGGLQYGQAVPGGPPDLMVFVTDGAPNRTNAGTATATDATAAAVTVANSIKAQGTHIFAVGVGDAAAPANEDRIRAISGGNRYPEHTDFRTADYQLVSNFADLANDMRTIVTGLCGSTLTITKRVPAPHGGWMEEPGWKFTATLHPAGHTWLSPSAGSAPSASQITGSDGIARFEWTFPTAVHTATLGVIHEAPEHGFEFVAATCTTVTPTGETEETSFTDIPGTTLGHADFHTCVVDNAKPPPPPGNGGDAGGGGGGGPAVPPSAPNLAVHKSMPAHARVGQRVTITITVHNHGHGAAHNVLLHESRPGGLRIVGVANHGSIQHHGAVLWHLGNLAPGATRTVHATAVVTRTGLHVDMAVAAASNGDAVFHRAAVRARAAARPPAPPPSPPPFTG